MIKYKAYEGWPISLTAKELNRSSDGWVVISRPHRDGLFIAAVSLETGMPWGGKIKIAQTVGDVEIARQEALRDLSKMGLGGAMADAGRHRAGRKAAARDNPSNTACSCGSAVPSRDFDRVLFGWRRVGGAWVCGKCAAVRGNPSGKVPDMKNVPLFSTVMFGGQRWTVDDVHGYPTKTVDLRRTIIVDPKRRYLDGAEFRRGVPVKHLDDYEVYLESLEEPRDNPSRKPVDHKFAGQLFSAGEPKTALAYLRGNLTKTTARELVAGKQAKRR